MHLSVGFQAEGGARVSLDYYCPLIIPGMSSEQSKIRASFTFDDKSDLSCFNNYSICDFSTRWHNNGTTSLLTLSVYVENNNFDKFYINYNDLLILGKKIKSKI